MLRESIYKRYKPAVQCESANNGRSYWFGFSSNKLLVKNEGEKVGIPHLLNLEELNLSPLRKQYLGTLQDSPCWSVELPPESTAPPGMSFSDLRPLYTVLDEDIFMLAGKAQQIVSWDQTHQYCGRCGQKTETLEGERAKICRACGTVSYPRLSPAVITAVLKDKKILLTHNVTFRGNWYSILAGFVEPGETLEECVRREIKEEVGIEVKNIKYFSSQPWPFPNSLMIGFTADWASGEVVCDGKEITDAGWYNARNMPNIPSRMSIAREIIDWCLQNCCAEA